MGWQLKTSGWGIEPEGWVVREASPPVGSCCCCTCKYCSGDRGRVWCCLVAIISNLQAVSLAPDEFLEACTQDGSSASAPAWPPDLKFCIKAKPNRSEAGISFAKIPYFSPLRSPPMDIYQRPANTDNVPGNSSSSSSMSGTSSSSSLESGGSCHWWAVIELTDGEKLFDFYGSGVGDDIFDLPQFLHIGIAIREDKIVMGASVHGPGVTIRTGEFSSTVARGDYGGLGIAIYQGEMSNAGCFLPFGDQWEFSGNQLVAGLESPSGIERLVGYTGGSAIAEPGCPGDEDELFPSSSSTSGAPNSFSSGSSSSASSNSSSSSSFSCMALSHGDRGLASQTNCPSATYSVKLQFQNAWTATPNLPSGFVRIKDNDGNWYYNLAGSGLFSDAYATNSGGNGTMWLRFAPQPGDGSGSCAWHKFQNDPYLNGRQMEILFNPTGLTPAICTVSTTLKANYP